MTINFSEGDEPPTILSAFSDTWLRDAAEKLAATVEAIQAGDFAQAKEAADCIKSLRLAVHSVMLEGHRIEKYSKQIAGVHGTGALELDAARDEIGRRLARLRDAGGG